MRRAAWAAASAINVALESPTGKPAFVRQEVLRAEDRFRQFFGEMPLSPEQRERQRFHGRPPLRFLRWRFRSGRNIGVAPHHAADKTHRRRRSLTNMRLNHLSASILMATSPLWAQGHAAASSVLAFDGAFANDVRRLVNDDLFSGVVLGASPDAEPWVITGGYADHEKTRPVTRDTVFNMASMTKMFTAVAIGQLVEAGKVAWDDPVTKHVPELRVSWAKPITIRHLLTHTSGLGGAPQPPADTPRHAHDWLELIAQLEPTAKPGETFIYSNAGFILLGVVIESATGEAYADYLKRHIWTPSQMTQTYFIVGDDEAAAVKSLARGFTRQPEGRANKSRPTRRSPGEELPARQPAKLTPRSSPAGGTYTTADDMLRFARALYGDQLLKRATRESMFEPQITPADERSAPGVKRSYALGFGVTEVHGQRLVGHNGGAAGASTQLYMDKDGAVLVILGNEDMAIMPVLRAFHQALTL